MQYTIEKQESAEQDYLIIRLPESGLTLSQWRTKGLSKEDKEILAMLVKEESAYQQKLKGRTPLTETLPINKIHITSSRSLAVLETLAHTHKLYFNHKQLVLDFYTPVKFYYQGELQTNQNLSIKGRIQWRDTDIDLSECQVIGPGKSPWFIKGMALKAIHTSISWKQLKQIYYTQTLVLEGVQKTTFLEELEEDEEGPQLVLINSNKADLKQDASPLPLLLLKDRLGAFADLWMDYGQDLKVMLQNPLSEIKDSKNRLSIKRQIDVEKNWEKDLLETDFKAKNSDTSHYYCPTHQIAKSLIFLLEIGWTIQDSKGNFVVRHGQRELNLEDEGEIIQIKGSVKFDEYEADIKDVIGAFNRRESFVQLSNNRVGLLTIDQDTQYLQSIAEECEVLGSSLCLKKNHFGTISDLFEKKELSSSLQQLRENIHNFQSIEEALPNSSFIGTLRAYQQVGLNWLSFLHEYHLHGILADDMGLGKTVQILAFLSRLNPVSPHLIVVPTSLLFNWRKEIEKFLPGTKYLVHQGSKRTQSFEDLCGYTIILTSYGTLRADAALFKQLNYHCVILDEAQVIKNSQTITAQTVYDLQAQMRLCITGTPIENHMNELWSHFHFLIPDLLGNLESFQAETQAGLADFRHLERIKRKIAPFILRRSKKEVLQDLPERMDQVVWIEMDDAQRKIYEHFLVGYKNNLIKKVELDGSSKHRMEIFEAILRLRQICCHPLLVSSLYEEDQSIESAKYDALEQDLATIVSEGGKVLIYSQFTSMLKLLAKLAQSNNWPYCYLDGSTQNREKVVEEFQESSGSMLFFISLKAGGVGLNLTAADYVFLYDPWWNEAVEEQAINRAHRIGRKEIVIAKRLIMSNSIEEKIMKLKASKRQIVEQMFDDIQAPFNLTIDDLKYLLS